ncbi:carbon-nitrogen hydrolase family protein [Limibaculum sp. M0105]|uniref:Carbon-nitrogen hydrolase family protein n=1 Tax=Thermohalobaculum xanthum TaxID=2753746 RepID=A0A8J7MA09_9RHOB|nr:carbon-nitrogen hydrolase family protein [Thermohalobaculum xanthum]MBK0400342.1 carbon-nitrogen hydrolase family protein [Thermohalobaculum xanthum]
MRIAVWQTTPVAADPEAGLARLEEAARAAAGGGARLLVTPEMALTGYAIGAEACARLARPQGGAYHEAVAAIARRHGIAVAFGYPEAAGGGVRNAAALVSAGGDVLADYAKTHLWGALDREQFVAGDGLSDVVELDGWRVSLAICFDIEFPEVARIAALRGAELVLVPTANMEPYRSVPRRIVPARADENGVYLAYANYVGAEGKQVYCGLSCVCGPDGEDAARAGFEPELLVATLDRDAVTARRAALPYLACRRPELYGDLT